MNPITSLPAPQREVWEDSLRRGAHWGDVSDAHAMYSRESAKAWGRFTVAQRVRRRIHCAVLDDPFSIY